MIIKKTDIPVFQKYQLRESLFWNV